MKVNKITRLLGLSAFIAFSQPVVLQASAPQYDGVNGSDFVAFKVNDAKLRNGIGSEQNLEKITSELDKVFADSQARLHRIVIIGYASPDGSYATNVRLARKRSTSLKDYVSRRYNLSKDMIEMRYVAEDWKGLETFVANASEQNLPNRDAMLQIVRSNLKADAKERALKTKYPQDFQYLKDYCLPQLRRTEYQIQYTSDASVNLSTSDFMGIPQESNGYTNATLSNTVAANDTLGSLEVVEIYSGSASEEDTKSLAIATQVESVSETASESAMSDNTEQQSESASTAAWWETNEQQSEPVSTDTESTTWWNATEQQSAEIAPESVSLDKTVQASEASEKTAANSLSNGNSIVQESLGGIVDNSQIVQTDKTTQLLYSKNDSQIVPDGKIVVSETTTHDSINGDAQVRFIINEYSLRPDYNGNNSDLEKITSILDKVTADNNIRLRRIIIHGYASPDGLYTFNEKLAYNRANAIRTLVTERYQLPTDFIEVESTAEDWFGLERLVKQTAETFLPHKAAILDLIQSNRHPDQKERILRSYRKDFEFMKDHILPYLRRTDYYIEYIVDNKVVVLDDAPKVPEELPAIETPKEKKPWYLAVKSNLLYDAAVLPNIGVEAYLGKQWTVLGDWFYTWFKNDNTHRYWQGYGGYLGLRKYFGAKAKEHPFTGHHAGLYGLMLTHDVEWGGRGYQMPHWGFGGGLEYGYSAPIARRLNLDFSIGVGFQDGKYYKYDPVDNHYVWRSTHHRHWFGPTKAEVSLVWLIGRGNYHKQYEHNTEEVRL